MCSLRRSIEHTSAFTVTRLLVCRGCFALIYFALFCFAFFVCFCFDLFLCLFACFIEGRGVDLLCFVLFCFFCLFLSALVCFSVSLFALLRGGGGGV